MYLSCIYSGVLQNVLFFFVSRLWVGAPKYSPKNVQPSSSTAKQGAIFSCQTGHVLVNDHEVTLNLNETQCVRTELKVQAALAASKNKSDSGNSLPSGENFLQFNFCL